MGKRSKNPTKIARKEIKAARSKAIDVMIDTELLHFWDDPPLKYDATASAMDYSENSEFQRGRFSLIDNDKLYLC